MILSWNVGAQASYAAVRGRVEDDGRIFLKELISALVLDTSPNGSVLGRVLRTPDFFLSVGKVTATRRLVPSERDEWNYFGQIALAAERFAEQEGVRTVGERHLAKVLIEFGRNKRFADLGLDIQRIHDEVRRLEIGPDFTEADLKGWHGLIDTNVILKSRMKPWEIDWRKISNSPNDVPVTIWISTVTLEELDTIPLRYREPELRRKASAFAVWFNEKVRKEEDFSEVPLGNDMRFRFWRALPAVTPDTQILDSAHSLRDKGLRIVVVTHDMAMRLRALDDGFDVAELPKDLLVADV